MMLSSRLEQKCRSSQPWIWRILLIATLSVVLAPGGEAQDLPNPLFAAEAFDTSVSFRSNVCDRQEMLHNKTIDLEHALEGLELRFLLSPSQYMELDPETGGLYEDHPGLIPDLIDLLAERAGFTWRNSYAVSITNPMEQNKTWTDLLEWSTDTYDVAADWWTQTLDRLSMGVRFPESWCDSSIIMVGDIRGEEETTQFSMTSWLKPFDYQVWILIALSILFSGIVYWILEGIDQNSDKRKLEKNILENIFLAGLAFTSQFEFNPRTNAARLFTFSLSLWALIIGASYTANLASFLVVKNSPKIVINTVADAVRFQLPICVWATTPSDTLVSSMYPNAKLVRVDFAEDMFLGVRSGECHLALTTVSSWDYFEKDKEVNGDCRLGWIGRTFQFIPAGFATRSDSGTLCTSLIADSLNVHLLRMKEENEIANTWKKFLARTATINCEELADTTDTQSEEESGQLTVKNVGGIFVIHYIMSFLAIFIAIVYKWMGWDQIPQFDKFGPNSREAIRKMLRSLSMAGKKEDMDPRQAMMFRAAEQNTMRDVVRKIKHRPHWKRQRTATKKMSHLRHPAPEQLSKRTNRLSFNPGDLDDLSIDSIQDGGTNGQVKRTRSLMSGDFGSEMFSDSLRLDEEQAPTSSPLAAKLQASFHSNNFNNSHAKLQESFRSTRSAAKPRFGAEEEILFQSEHSTGSEPSLEMLDMSNSRFASLFPPTKTQTSSETMDAQTSRYFEYLAQRQTTMERKQDEMYENVAKILAHLHDKQS